MSLCYYVKKLFLCILALHFTSFVLGLDFPDLSLSTQKLLSATLANDPATATQAIKEGASVLAHINKEGRMPGMTVMHFAVLESHIAIVKVLLNNNVPIDTLRDSKGYTPLMLFLGERCCRLSDGLTEKEMRMLSFLIQNGADINAHVTNNPTITAMILACGMLKTNIDRLLLDSGAIPFYKQNPPGQKPIVFNELHYMTRITDFV